MGKLRYAAPALVAVATVGASLAQASPAMATTHNVHCRAGENLCLWYSDLAGSAIFQTQESVVASNFSYDCADYWPAACRYDYFTGGTGANKAVRNDAHSIAANNPGAESEWLYSLPNDRGYTYPFAFDSGKPVTLIKAIRNNEASYKSRGCSLAAGNPWKGPTGC